MDAVNGERNISNGITQTITQITQNRYSNPIREKIGNKKTQPDLVQAGFCRYLDKNKAMYTLIVENLKSRGKYLKFQS